MGIYIKGLKKPERCADCRQWEFSHIDPDGYGVRYDYCYALSRRVNEEHFEHNPFKGRLSDCPIVDVSVPECELIEKYVAMFMEEEK